ncbi:DUF1636 family protein [Yoonia sp. GPGPB17]|uniref:DUF1636 family protein n=1 Tax=Yoonia sp. GPGPB17 TaxID=3026147 RepID=UPI0030BD23CF
MDRTTQHRITVCTSCKHKGTDCRPGYELIEKLRKAIAAAGDSISEDFAISGVACMAGCDRLAPWPITAPRRRPTSSVI